MKSIVSFLVFLLTSVPAVEAFTSSAAVGISSTAPSTSLLLSKKNPQGSPITVQEDEDAAMWIESKDGKRQKVLKSPVGGRPINKVTKEMVDKQGKQKKKGWFGF